MLVLKSGVLAARAIQGTDTISPCPEEATYGFLDGLLTAFGAAANGALYSADPCNALSGLNTTKRGLRPLAAHPVSPHKSGQHYPVMPKPGVFTPVRIEGKDLGPPSAAGLLTPDYVTTFRDINGDVQQKLHFTVPTGASVREELQFASDAAVAALDYLPR